MKLYTRWLMLAENTKIIVSQVIFLALVCFGIWWTL